MLKINNEQLNRIRKGLDRIEKCYNQSIDPKVRLAVKDRVYYDLVENIYGFDTEFSQFFENCEMSSLSEIGKLQDKIYASLEVVKMPPISAQTVKRLFKKLPEKYQKKILADYNEKCQKYNMTYYSLEIDNSTKIFIFNNCGDFCGEVCKIGVNKSGLRESNCCFCNELRMGADIMHISRVIKTKQGNYSSKMVSCCSNDVQCNHDIVNRTKFDEFFK